MKQWTRSEEWKLFGDCTPLHIVPPERLSDDECEEVQKRCWGCKVRPECLQSTVDNKDTGVWSGSVWIPEVSIDDTKSEAYAKLGEAARIREELAGTIDDELKRRGEF